MMRVQNSDVSSIRFAERKRVVDAWQAISCNHSDPTGLQCIHDVALATKESQQFVKTWVLRYAERRSYAALHDLPRSGRKRKANAHAVAGLVFDPTVKSSFRAAASRSKEALGVHVSKSTVARRVHERHLRKRVVRKGSGLTQSMIMDRQRWARAHVRHSWQTCFMLDSCVIPYSPPPSVHRGRWAEVGEDPIIVDGRQGPQVHVYAGVSPYGKSMIYMVTGTTGLPHRYERDHRGASSKTHAGVAHAEFLDVLKSMLSLAREEMPVDMRSHMTVMMDRAPAHTSREVRQFMREQGFRDYLLPTKAGDINWMDWTFWNGLKQRLWGRLKECNNFKEFTKLVPKVWEGTDDKAVLRSLCKKQRERVERIAKNGRMIP